MKAFLSKLTEQLFFKQVTKETIKRIVSNNFFKKDLISRYKTSLNRHQTMWPAESLRMNDGNPAVFENSVFEPGKLLKTVYDLTLKENLANASFESEKVVEFLHPEQLQTIFDLSVARSGCQDLSEIEEILERVVRYSVKTQHPNFFNQFYGGIDEVGLSGAWLTDALNTNPHTFEVAPVFVLIEHYMIQRIVQLFGWKEGDGIFAPGGSVSNMYGISCAKHHRYPEIKSSGFFGRKPLVILTSDMSHYSIKKAAIWMGFGSDQVVSVPSNSEGKMTAEALRNAIHQVREHGREPLMVTITAGTTVLGAFDPIPEIADVCAEESLWLHADACWGGTVALSSRHRSLLKGIERADSLAWNPHKMLCVPLQCSTFLVKNKNILNESNCIGASYLFQTDKFYDTSYDTGDKSFQCGRKIDAFKLWLMFKVHGTDVLGERVDVAFEVARYLEAQLKSRPGFRMVLENPQCTNICFWYIPPSLRGLKEDESWHTKLHKIAPTIKAKMVLDGTLMIGYQPLEQKGLVNFFRMVLRCYPQPTKARMDFVLDEIEKHGFSL